jgi:hypothetical protein
MAAYCHLVEMCEGFGSPYGIVLWAGTYRAMSVPNTPQARRELHEQVVRAKEAIRAAEHRHKLPKPPSRKSLCERCPLGKPVAYVPGEGFSRHGVPLRVYKVQNDGMKFYHSHCGDRFRWVPPHAKALDLDLMPLSTAKILATLISTDEWL